jgi:chromate transporter
LAVVREEREEPAPPAGPAPSRPPPLRSIFLVFARIGLMSFGGGLSGWMYREIAERRRWLPEAQFLSAMALGQILPGGNAVNLAVQVGLRLRGLAGAGTAALGTLAPPFVVILLLAAVYGRLAGLPATRTALSGMAAVGVAMMLTVVIKAARRLRGLVPAGVAVLVFVAVGVLRWPVVPVVIVLAPVSAGWAHWRAGRPVAHG